MKRLKGPELKMPELKVPEVVADLFYDLRDRRLLPLVGLVVVAIVAVPFLLGGDSDEALEVPAGGGLREALESAKSGSSSLAVVEAQPGLRDYHKRLRAQRPTDPFKQRYTAPSLKGAELNEKKGASGSTSGDEKTSTSTTNGSAAGGGAAPAPPSGQEPPAGGSPNDDGNPAGSEVTLFAFAINVRIVKSVGGVQQEPILRERVLPQVSLPNKKEPVVTYMGPARKGKKLNGKVLLLVNNDVRSVEGDANCLSGDELCQLLEVEPGFPVVLTFGDDEARYSINVLKLGLVVTGHT